MNFSSIPTGTAVFLDSNVFVYSCAEDPTFGDACTALLERIKLADLRQRGIRSAGRRLLAYRS